MALGFFYQQLFPSSPALAQACEVGDTGCCLDFFHAFYEFNTSKMQETDV